MFPQDIYGVFSSDILTSSEFFARNAPCCLFPELQLKYARKVSCKALRLFKELDRNSDISPVLLLLSEEFYLRRETEACRRHVFGL